MIQQPPMGMTAPEPCHAHHPGSDGGVYDARWTELLVFLLQRLPTSLCVFLTGPLAFVVYLFSKSQGRAVRANLRVLLPERGELRCWWGGYQVFRQFALTYLDRLLFRYCGRPVEWDVRGMEYFEQMKNEPGGALVFTVHSGNYDVGSSLMAERLGRPLHTVRVPERSRSMGHLRTAEFDADSRQQPFLRVHYNTPDSHLGIDLCRLLLAGEIVAVQGDRVVMDVAPLAVVHGDVSYTIPLGPFMLAATARVPCYPMLSVRSGVCQYRIELSKPFGGGRDRLTRSELAGLWVPIMADFLHRHWDQWFVFEPILRREPAAAKRQPGC